MMAPRVDRTVARVSPPGGARRNPIREDRNRRPIRDLERTPNPFEHPECGISCHSSRVKVQPVRGDDRVVEPGTAATRGGRLAQLVRALP